MSTPRTLKYCGATYVLAAAYPHGFAQGDKVRFKPGLTIDLEDAMLGVLQLGGLTGRVSMATNKVVRVRLDKIIPAIDEWENSIIFQPGVSAKDAQLGEFPIDQISKYIEKLAPPAGKVPLKQGDKVRFKSGYVIEMFPQGIFKLGGQTGVVVLASPGSVWIKLDKHYPELDEWHNEIGYLPNHHIEELQLGRIMQYLDKI